MCSDGRLAAHSLGTIYASHLIFRMADDLNNMPSRLIDEVDMENTQMAHRSLLQPPAGETWNGRKQRHAV